jgi:hypothetical protein
MLNFTVGRSWLATGRDCDSSSQLPLPNRVIQRPDFGRRTLRLRFRLRLLLPLRLVLLWFCRLRLATAFDLCLFFLHHPKTCHPEARFWPKDLAVAVDVAFGVAVRFVCRCTFNRKTNTNTNRKVLRRKKRLRMTRYGSTHTLWQGSLLRVFRPRLQCDHRSEIPARTSSPTRQSNRAIADFSTQPAHSSWRKSTP